MGHPDQHLRPCTRPCGGTIPRKIVRQVRATTYHQVWWPAHEVPVFTDRLPRWSPEEGGYVDPDTGWLLPTWDEALDALDADPDTEPAHVLRFGGQDNLQGLLAGSPGRTGLSANWNLINIIDPAQIR